MYQLLYKTDPHDALRQLKSYQLFITSLEYSYRKQTARHCLQQPNFESAACSCTYYM